MPLSLQLQAILVSVFVSKNTSGYRHSLAARGATVSWPRGNNEHLTVRSTVLSFSPRSQHILRCSMATYCSSHSTHYISITHNTHTHTHTHYKLLTLGPLTGALTHAQLPSTSATGSDLSTSSTGPLLSISAHHHSEELCSHYPDHTCTLAVCDPGVPT